MEEQKLLLGLQQKEEQALEECVWQYGAYAAAVVRAAGPGLSPQDVEEVAAEAFVKLWQAADRLDVSKGTLKSYLGAVCRNEARSRLRTLRPMEPLPEDFLAPAEQAAQNLERKELERLTREAVDTLDAGNLSAVLLPLGKDRTDCPGSGPESVYRQDAAGPWPGKTAEHFTGKGRHT